MPRVPIADNQVGIAQPLNPHFQAADNGGGVAGGIAAGAEYLGKQMSGAADAMHEVQSQAEATNFSKAFADYRVNFDRYRDDQRANVGPGAVDYTKNIDQAYSEGTKPLLADIKDPGVRRRAEAAVQTYRGDVLDSEYKFELSSRIDKVVTDVEDTLDSSSARVRTSSDPKAYDQERAQNASTITLLTGIGDKTRQALLRKNDEKLAGAYLGGLIDRDPAVARTQIESGRFNNALDGKQIDTFLAQADVGVRRIASEQQHQQALAKAALNEEIATTNAQLRDGIKVPDEHLADLASRAAAIGDTSNAFDLSAARVRSQTNDLIKGWTPVQLETERNRLSALKSPTASDQVRLDQITKRMPELVDSYNKDRGKWAAQNGVPPPVIDWNKPETLAARGQWAATVSRATGGPTPLLSPAELEGLKTEAAGSPAAELAVINKVAMIGGREAITTMRQVVPSDPKAATLVRLAPTVRGQALAGLQELAARPDTLPDKIVRQPFMDRLGTAGSLMDGSEVEGAYSVAKGLYVDAMRKSGKDPAAYDQGAWNQAIHSALGGTFDGKNWHGGVWSWNKQQVLIPPTITGRQFEGAMTKLTSGVVRWERAGPNANNQPTWGNGAPMSLTSLRGFTPVLRPDGLYEFHGSDGTIAHTKSGAVFAYNLAKMAQQFPQ